MRALRNLAGRGFETGWLLVLAAAATVDLICPPWPPELVGAATDTEFRIYGAYLLVSTVAVLAGIAAAPARRARRVERAGLLGVATASVYITLVAASLWETATISTSVLSLVVGPSVLSSVAALAKWWWLGRYQCTPVPLTETGAGCECSR